MKYGLHGCNWVGNWYQYITKLYTSTFHAANAIIKLIRFIHTMVINQITNTAEFSISDLARIVNSSIKTSLKAFDVAGNLMRTKLVFRIEKRLFSIWNLHLFSLFLHNATQHPTRKNLIKGKFSINILSICGTHIHTIQSVFEWYFYSGLIALTIFDSLSFFLLLIPFNSLLDSSGIEHLHVSQI